MSRVKIQIPTSEWLNEADCNKYFLDLIRDDSETQRFKTVGLNNVEVRAGPILRLIATHEKEYSYRASMLLVTRENLSFRVGPQLHYQLGQCSSAAEVVSVEEAQITPELIHEQDQLCFWRYKLNFNLADYEQKCKYYLDYYHSPEFFFYLPALSQSMNIMFYSCNGFLIGTDAKDYRGLLWHDVLRTHLGGTSPYHVMVGGGDQIYCDVIKTNLAFFKQWLQETSSKKRQELAERAGHKEQFEQFYLEHYLGWYGRGFVDGTKQPVFVKHFPKALATIPLVNVFDDHDLIDGYGSYEDKLNGSPMFKSLGEAGFKFYLLFQHHTALLETDASWILGSPGRYIQEKSRSLFARLGQKIALVGVDCRTERTLTQIVSRSSYDILYDRIEQELSRAPAIKHLLVLLGVPILYPRLVLMETILNNSVTKTITSQLKKLHLGAGILQDFDGSIDIIDDLNDHWCSDNHKPERNKFLANLQLIQARFGVRITFLSGDVHLAAVGRVKTDNGNSDPLEKVNNRATDYGARILANDKVNQVSSRFMSSDKLENFSSKYLSRETPLPLQWEDPRLMLNVISSAIINTPPPTKMAEVLFNVQKPHHFGKETYEDMVPIFKRDVNGELLDSRRQGFQNRRNWADIIPVENDPGLIAHLDKLKVPGPVDKAARNPMAHNGSELGYRVEVNGLAARIHVERDMGSLDSQTQDYEIVIPSLSRKYNQLKQTKIKHVNQ